MMALDPSQIASLLKHDAQPKRGGGSRTPKDVTEPREITVWYKLPHKLADFEFEGKQVTPHCENPDCSDPRPPSDRGRNIVASIKGKMMCRFCFLNGWLSDNEQQSNDT
jgi:hypothetical protein